MNRQKNNIAVLKKISDKIESIYIFGNLSTYITKIKNGLIYVCLNDGQFHFGNKCNQAGYSKFIGAFTKQEAIDFLEQAQ